MLCDLENAKNMSYIEVTRVSKNVLLIFNTNFTKFKSSEIKSSIWFDCGTQSNSIHGLSSIEIQFDWVRLTMFGFCVNSSSNNCGLVTKSR